MIILVQVNIMNAAKDGWIDKVQLVCKHFPERVHERDAVRLLRA